MKTFTFEAYNKKFTAQAVRGLDVMEDANRAILWPTKESKMGTWWDRDDTSYYWVEGNFFD